MAQLKTAGKHWRYARRGKSEHWEIFGAKGRIRYGRWILDTSIFSEDPLWSDAIPFVPTDPNDYLPNAIEILLRNMKSVQRFVVSYISIPPFRGLLLALEGVLSLEVLNRAIETQNAIKARIETPFMRPKVAIVISPIFTACRAYTAKGIEITSF